MDCASEVLLNKENKKPISKILIELDLING
jgi:hypothetical protein